MPTLSKITPCLWFDTQAEEAATFYTSLFEGSRITEVTHYGSAGPRPEGMVMTVEFELAGQPFTALNGGPESSGGGAEGPCGWVKDRFGLSWQIVPTRFTELLRESEPEAAQRAVKAMLGMKRLDIAALEAAAAG